MVLTLLRTTLALSFILLTNLTFGQKFGFNAVLEASPEELTVFCVPNHQANISLLDKNGITVKFSTENWLFINATPRWIDEHVNDGSLDDFYFEFAPPVTLADTSRAHHNVDQVHQGMAPLGTGYTGQDVIIGVVDTGLDWTHPDFIDQNGNTRVLRYWDMSFNGPNPPQPYGYGQEWDSTEINTGACTSNEEASAHGTTVAGLTAGNGGANGQNVGIAPGANLVIVESNFSLPNWTLTIADAVDYVFSVADSYGMPAVVNLSLGTYLGSHDGNDPASEAIEALLDEKGGRIVVSAAGNSGNQSNYGKYHLHHDVSATDTNFVWFLNNPTAAIAPNTIFFDLWSDQADATFNFAIGADSPGYSFRGRTNFHGAMSSIGTVIEDTIWNGPNRIATIEVYTSLVNGNYNMQMFVSNVDSTSYNYRFETVGTGSFDLWSGKQLGYNNMVTSIPTVGQMPDIVNYIMPDSLQTVVSSWNCSEMVVSVGNFTNRKGHIDANLNPYVSSSTPGLLSLNSSKGPNRHGVIKPDISAAGDVTLSAGPSWLLTNPAWNSVIDSNGVHVRNGGTSMASPVVAGIAALYLSRCQFANYQGFINDLQATAYTDGYTGVVPNNAYGYGKADAFAIVQELTFGPQPTVTYDGQTPSLVSSAASGYQWYIDGTPVMGETNQSIEYNGDGDYQVEAINTDGCPSLSNPFAVTANIEEIGIDNIVVYPNPGSEKIQFITNETIISVHCIDINGKQIELELSDTNTCNLHNLSSGTYSLVVTTNKRTRRAKIVRL